MILPDGSQIPDRPTGPREAVRDWKIMYYTKLYGTGKEFIAKQLQKMEDAHDRLPLYIRIWRRIIYGTPIRFRRH